MRMRRAIGLSFAFLAISGLALAKPSCAAEERQQQPHSVKAKAAKPDRSPTQRASVQQRKQEGAAAAAGQHDEAKLSDASKKPVHKRQASGSSKKPEREDRLAGSSTKPASEDRLAGSSQDPAALKAVGRQEIGMAAWYGGHHLGQRTASGAVLDSVTPTAAHRSLPLNSLVRITNLRNGRSVICKVNDRGPWGRNRLIDVSPRAADELDMKRSGIAKVSVEPVAATAHASLH